MTIRGMLQPGGIAQQEQTTNAQTPYKHSQHLYQTGLCYEYSKQQLALFGGFY